MSERCIVTATNCIYNRSVFLGAKYEEHDMRMLLWMHFVAFSTDRTDRKTKQTHIQQHHYFVLLKLVPKFTDLLWMHFVAFFCPIGVLRMQQAAYTTGGYFWAPSMRSTILWCCSRWTLLCTQQPNCSENEANSSTATSLFRTTEVGAQLHRSVVDSNCCVL